jgi:YD repeat-containing protein
MKKNNLLVVLGCFWAILIGLGCDNDGDGYCEGAPLLFGNCPNGWNDCNDNDPAIHPGATELCDNKDNNCDGIIDEIKCDDNNTCTKGDWCSKGVCKGNLILFCCDDHDECTDDEWDMLTKQCKYTQKPEGAICDDGNPCTVNDKCINKACVGDEEKCDDDDQCTKDFCSKNFGCFHYLLQDCFTEPVNNCPGEWDKSVSPPVWKCFEPEDIQCDNPSDEICNNKDDDCDGFTDEGFTKNACGGCSVLEIAPNTPCGNYGKYICKDTETIICNELIYKTVATGIVYDGTTGQAISSATVTVQSTGDVYYTNSTGRFFALLPYFGDHYLKISKSKYNDAVKIVPAISNFAGVEDTYLFQLQEFTIQNHVENTIVSFPDGLLKLQLNTENQITINYAYYNNYWELPLMLPEDDETFIQGLHIDVDTGIQPVIQKIFLKDAMGFSEGTEFDVYALDKVKGEWMLLSDQAIISENYFEFPASTHSDYVIVTKSKLSTEAMDSDFVNLTIEEREIIEKEIDELKISSRTAGIREVYNRRGMETQTGKCHNVSLMYDTESSNPYIYLSAGAFINDIPMLKAPDTMSFLWSIEGDLREIFFIGSKGYTHFPVYKESQDITGKKLDTGLYPYWVIPSNNYRKEYLNQDSNPTGIITKYPVQRRQENFGYVSVVNLENSPYGAGWSIGGLKRIYSDPTGQHFMILDGTRGVISSFEIFGVNFDGTPQALGIDGKGNPYVAVIRTDVEQGNINLKNEINIVKVKKYGIGSTYFNKKMGDDILLPSLPPPENIELPIYLNINDMVVDKATDIYFSYNKGKECIVGMISGEAKDLIMPYAGKETACGFVDNVEKSAARFNGIKGLALDLEGNLIVADSGNKRIRKIDKNAGFVTTIAGTSAPSGGQICEWTDALSLSFSSPVNSIAFDSQGNLYITENDMIHVMRPDRKVKTIAIGPNVTPDQCSVIKLGTLGKGLIATFSANELFVYEEGGHRIIKLTKSDENYNYNLREVISAQELEGYSVEALKIDHEGNLYVIVNSDEAPYSQIFKYRKINTTQEYRLIRKPDGSIKLLYSDDAIESFSSDGLLQSHITLQGEITSYTYLDDETYPSASLPRIDKITYPDGKYTEFKYTGSGFLKEIIDNDGYKSIFKMDSSNNLVLLLDPDANFRMNIYDSNHLLKGTINESLIKTEMIYNELMMTESVLSSSEKGTQFAPKNVISSLLNNIAGPIGRIDNPIEGYTGILGMLSSFMEKTCVSDSQCTDMFQWTTDTCIYGFCQNETGDESGYEIGFSCMKRGDCTDPNGCGPKSVGSCTPETAETDCDDGDNKTWDVCLSDTCYNLPICPPEGCGYLGACNIYGEIDEECMKKVVSEDEITECYFSSDCKLITEEKCRYDCLRKLFREKMGCIEVFCMTNMKDMFYCLSSDNCKPNDIKWGKVGLCEIKGFKACCNQNTVKEDCEDNIICTEEKCVNSVCQYDYVQNGKPCEDMNACTAVTECKNGKCEPTHIFGKTICIDGINCTEDDICDPWTGCDFTHYKSNCCIPSDQDFTPPVLTVGENDNCNNENKIVCTWDSTSHVWHKEFLINAGSEIDFLVAINNCIEGEQPDSVAYLVLLDENKIVAINDDGNIFTKYDKDSYIHYKAEKTGTYMFIVTSKYQGYGGKADIIITYDGDGSAFGNQVFGGYHVTGKEIKSGDALFVGKNNNIQNASEFYDTTLFVIATDVKDDNCETENCGQLYFYDDYKGMFLTMAMDLPSIPSAKIIVGSGKESTENTINIRLFHRRNYQSWGIEETKDNDGDGLTFEIEEILGTCDKLNGSSGKDVGVIGYNCSQFRDMINNYLISDGGKTSCPNIMKINLRCDNENTPYDPGDKTNYECWHPCDSDNDGIRDDIEVFGVVSACEKEPVSPYYDAGKCIQLPLLSTLYPSWAKYHFRGLAVSALRNPDNIHDTGPAPTVFDIYLQNDYFAATATTPPHSHEITPNQQNALDNVWTNDPQTCWDGNPPVPDQNGILYCPDSNESLYRARMHAYNGNSMEVRIDYDDALIDQLYTIFLIDTNTRWVNSFFNHSFLPGNKHSGIFHYSFSSDFSGGQSDYKTAIWANNHDYDIYRSFSHETGHILKLKHIYTSEPYDAGSPTFHCCPVNHPQVPLCIQNQTWITFQTFIYPSLMNYLYTDYGISSKSPSPNLPLAGIGTGNGTNGCCRFEFLRFSKGLNQQISETNVSENIGNDWNAKKLAREICCFNDNYIGGAAVGPGMCNNYYAPQCATDLITGAITNCSIDWNYNNTIENNSYSVDLNHMDWDNKYSYKDIKKTDVPGCSNDIIEDHNDWLSIFSNGKTDLLHQSYYSNFYIYVDGFNGGAVKNLAGWDFPINETLASEKAINPEKYEQNVCKNVAECTVNNLAQNCRKDFCNQGCVSTSPGCDNNICKCNNDDDCFSRMCNLSTNLCQTDYGTCACNVTSMCPEGGAFTCNNITGICNNKVQIFQESAHFTGWKGNTYLDLINTGATSPINAISDSDEFMMSVDFRFDEFNQGNLISNIINSSTVSLELLNLPNGIELSATLRSQDGGPIKIITYPDISQNIGKLLEVHKWYRVYFGVNKIKQRFFLTVLPWDKLHGKYSNWEGCLYKIWNNELHKPSNINIGQNPDNILQKFNGFIDNIMLANTPFYYDLIIDSQTCSEQQ